MGVRLIVEVLDHAPEDLTPAERLVLVVLAEAADDNTRECWPGLDSIARRSGMHPTALRRMFARWSGRRPPIEVRVAIATGRDGRPVYSAPGRRTIYRVPVLISNGATPGCTFGGVNGAIGGSATVQNGATAGYAVEAEWRNPDDRNGATPTTEWRNPGLPPSPHQPSENPDRSTVGGDEPTGPDADINTAAAALGVLPATVDRVMNEAGLTLDEAREAIAGTLAKYRPGRPDAYIVTCIPRYVTARPAPATAVTAARCRRHPAHVAHNCGACRSERIGVA